MRKLVYILFVLIVLFSCEKYPEPGFETMESFSFSFLGNNQMAEAGKYLAEDIGVQINYDSPSSSAKKTFYMELEVAIGDGKIDKQKILADESGKMTSKWQLGFKSNEQIINAKIFDSSDFLYADFEMEATSILMDDWNTITTGFLTSIQDMVVDTINKRSLMISFRDLYWIQGNESKFYEWQKIYKTIPSNFKDIEINSKGEVFGGDWDGNLYKSKDWGQSWSFICKPILDETNFDLSISADDYIWVSKWGHGVYCSKDDGRTWQKDIRKTPYKQPLGRVYLFNDTSHIAISLEILQTFNDGNSWNAINTPQLSLNIFVTDKNDIIVQTQGGFTLYKSKDSGKTYTKILSPNSNYVTTSHNCYKKFEDYYYVLAPRAGIWKTKDFEEFEKLITLDLQKNLFIDHTGTIYAAAFLNNDPTLVLPRNE